MIKYSQKEMEYISQKSDVMKDLVSHFGYMEKGMPGDVFSSLVMHIIGQMLSNRVAEVLSQRFLHIVGDMTPGHVLAVDIDAIKQCGISKRKAEYIMALAQEVTESKYDFSLLENMSDEEVIKYLMQIKGVGRWTAEMIAEFTMGRLDIFSYDDVALQNGIMKAHGFKTLSRQRFEGLRKKYTPYCSVASLYYYALNDER
ncbi:DNA-3-methyladenine glycosylase [Lacrimispora sp.]|uniref:DNA-3-methyladenine glycosylase family protein n=1 Tax=Lacrimispora sp. TaxID=2719234 RepID=UPI00345FB8F5